MIRSILTTSNLMNIKDSTRGMGITSTINNTLFNIKSSNLIQKTTKYHTNNKIRDKMSKLCNKLANQFSGNHF